jgi:membrane associated rhomboid family serine protease
MKAWVCTHCRGAATTVESLNRVATPESFQAVWGAARAATVEGDRPCPACGRHMGRFDGGEAAGHVELDACRACRVIWFDSGELGRVVAPPPPPEPPARELPLEARRAIAIEAARRVRESAEKEDGRNLGKLPENPWHLIPALLGLPFEEGAPALARWPWATWALIAAMVAVTAIAMRDLPFSVRALGLVPADPWRGGGLTLVSSFLLHGGILHLLGNAYFLALLGDNAEDVLGRGKYLILVAVAALAGDAAHMLLDPRSSVPLVGASGGISGVVAFYCLRFPRAKLGFMARYWWRFAWVRLPAPAWFAFWIALQVGGAFAQAAGCTSVSAFAHLGGAAVGVAAWLLWGREPSTACQPSAPGA